MSIEKTRSAILTVSNFDLIVYKVTTVQVNDSKLHRLIGETLRDRRKQTGMTQTDLASKVGLLRTSITNIEAGRQKPPIQVLYNICLVLGIEAREILPTNAEALQGEMVEVEVEGKKTSVPPKAAKLLNELLTQ
jgi:transcriptional regulator with XRE-family HTH domain